jgi:hypothetical protein
MNRSKSLIAMAIVISFGFSALAQCPSEIAKQVWGCPDGPSGYVSCADQNGSPNVCVSIWEEWDLKKRVACVPSPVHNPNSECDRTLVGDPPVPILDECHCKKMCYYDWMYEECYSDGNETCTKKWRMSTYDC